VPPGVAEARVKLPKIIESAPEGVAIEDKGHALAVHTRRAAEPEVALERLRGLVAALAERTGLTLEPGRFVLELRPPGMDKGAALRALVAELGSTAVLYGGDDLGDLAAFDAVDALRAEGVPGVTVCSASDEVIALAERADLVVDGPPGVVRLVESLTSELF
jgi:trehalose 6-phosphate phosphatase